MYPDIRMIAADLDGTLLGPDKQYSPYTLQVLQMADGRGIRIVPATGRPRCALPAGTQDLPFFRYAITSNGSSIFDLQSGRRLYACDLDADKTRRILEILCDAGVSCEVFSEGNAYADRRRWENPLSAPEGSWHRRYVQSTRRPADDMPSLIRRLAGSIEGFNIIVPDPQQRRSMHKALSAIGGLYITASSSFNLEVADSRVSKAAACAYLAGRFGLAQSQTAAFGDSLNDLEMLRFAGLGVAMGNADPELIRQADDTAPDCSRDGAAWYIEHKILGTAR